MRTIFWNTEEFRLRAFWRILFTFILLVLCALVVFLVWFGVMGLNDDPGLFGLMVMGTLIVLITIPLATRFIDRRKFSETGIYFNKAWWIDLGFGMIIGAALMTLIFLMLFASGLISIRETMSTISGVSLPVGFILSFVYLVWVGVVEELLFRGYLLLNMAEGLNFRRLGPRGALLTSWILTAMLYGYLHHFNLGATLFSTANIAVSGLWFGLGYILTGSLAIPIGMHITWNFFQGVVFGSVVRGEGRMWLRMIVVEDHGPAYWTGGSFGPENSLLCTLVMLVGMLMVLAWIQIRTGKLEIHIAIADPPERIAVEELHMTNDDDGTSIE